MLSVRFASVRRVLGLALVIATPVWQLEAVAGVMRDGVVHHEAASAAASHTSATSGEHGHEDGLPPAQHPHGSQHQHGTPADHCSHAHGFAVVTAFSMGFHSHVFPHPQIEDSVSFAWSPSDQFHPPRA